MSGSDIPIVDLIGSSMSALIHAIPETASRTGRPVIVIGGLAVICRLSDPYRATSDLDTVNRRANDEMSQLDLLVASGATANGPVGVVVPTPSGDVHVDVLEVSDADLDNLPDDPTARLHVLAHSWAADSATPIIIRVHGLADLQVLVAEPGPLIAMKLQSVMDRGAAKEGTDLLDIVRLTLDRRTGPVARTQLSESNPQLRADAALHVDLWFRTNIDRSLSVVGRVPEGRELAHDDLELVGELLSASVAQ